MPPILDSDRGHFLSPRNDGKGDDPMILLEANHIKYDVQDRLLLDVTQLRIYPNERIGLVGPNGCGKSTLLRILSGQLAPDQGSIQRYARCELLPQLKDAIAAKSGGEVTQAYVLEALLEAPDLLLADEPTTHLDTEHMEWLEKHLRDWQGACVIVSHDRAFLDALCTKIWEIRDGQVHSYTGNYSEYVEQKKLEQQQQQQAYEQYEMKKKQLEAALERKEAKAERATKKPKKVSSSEAKITGARPYFAKKQKKLQKTAKAIETRIEKLEKVDKVKETPPLKMNLPNEDILRGRIIIRVKDVAGSIGDRVLWQPASFYIRGGDKVAILGPNGSGKTTLVKKIIDQADGISISPAVKIGYFSQDLSIIDPALSVLSNVRLTSIQDETLIRTVLARLHFFRDDVYKPVAVLSGGERVKVALAKLFLSDINTLVLDEPTNFLDLAAVTALESLLQEYKGTIIFVSHDRRFVEQVATRGLVIHNQQIQLQESREEGRISRNQPDRPRPHHTSEEEKLVLEMKISEVLSRLSMEPSEELEAEFQRLLLEKKKLQGPASF